MSVLDNIERIEAHELRPQDILCVHLAHMESQDIIQQIQQLVQGGLRDNGFENLVFIFAGGMRVDVLRHEDAEVAA